MSEARLRAAYRGLIREPGDARDACPSAEALDALVLRQGPEAERVGVLDHVMACAACRRELDLLRALQQAAPKERTLARPLALAATVVLAIAAGLTWNATRPATDPLRGNAAPVQLVAPADELAVSGLVPVEFVWRPVTDAVSYTVEVVDGEDRVAIRQEARDTMLLLSRDQLGGDVAFRWRVRAHLPGGGEVSSPWRRLTAAAP